MGGIETVAAAIGADLAARLPRQNKKQREGLALLVATALDVRDVNLMDLAAALPRAAERLDMRYQWISRLLGNPLIDPDAVMAPFAREVLARAGAQACTPGLIIDQSQVNAAHQMVMVSLRVGGRALPLSRLPLAHPRMVCLALLCVAGVGRAASVGQAAQPCLAEKDVRPHPRYKTLSSWL